MLSLVRAVEILFHKCVFGCPINLNFEQKAFHYRRKLKPHEMNRIDMQIYISC